MAVSIKRASADASPVAPVGVGVGRGAGAGGATRGWPGPDSKVCGRLPGALIVGGGRKPGALLSPAGGAAIGASAGGCGAGATIEPGTIVGAARRVPVTVSVGVMVGGGSVNGD